MATEAEAASTTEPRHGRWWTLVVERVFPFLTALLTVVTATVGVVAARATSQRNDLETSVSALEDTAEVLQEDNEALREQVATLTESRDHWRDVAEAPASSEPGEPAVASSPPEGTCQSSDDPQIWITPAATPVDSDFSLTVSGSCFEPGSRLRIAISEDSGICIDVTCTDLGDVVSDGAGGFADLGIDVLAAGVYELDSPGTVYVLAYDDDQLASQPLRLT